MGTRNRTVPRFLPTLTDVVPGHGDLSEPQDDTAIESEAGSDTAAALLPSVHSAIAPHLEQALSEWLQEQLASPTSALRQQIESILQEACVRELAKRAGAGA